MSRRELFEILVLKRGWPPQPTASSSPQRWPRTSSTREVGETCLKSTDNRLRVRVLQLLNDGDVGVCGTRLIALPAGGEE